MKKKNNPLQNLVSLCKRRGYVFPSSEIYGGINSCWDYGPLGIELKRNIKELWWREMTYRHDNIVGIDASIIMHPKVWETSGHISEFTDPLVDCKSCKKRFRADEIQDESVCPECGGELTKKRDFNLMFRTNMGPVLSESSVVYLRPETAQGIYVNYENVRLTSRSKIPFGIAQIGKAFRNEITPGNFIFRTREFEQMEMQFFIKPGEDNKWFDFWKEERYKWYLSIGINPDKLRFHDHAPDELAHYAKKATDIEFEFPFGWSELEGIHNRTDFDLSRHQDATGKSLSYLEPHTNERYIPYIIETSAGCDRTILTVLSNGYCEEEVNGKKRVLLKLDPKVAPIKIAVFPLIVKSDMYGMGDKIYHDLKNKYYSYFDTSGAIGRRYRRQDEAGTPYCVTVDGQSLEDKTVTIRERDSMNQVRVSTDKLMDYFDDHLKI